MQSKLDTILTTSCDERTILDQQSGKNKYFINPANPDKILSRGSCTSGNLTSFSKQVGLDFLKRKENEPFQDIVNEHRNRIKQVINNPDVEVYFASSGSDLGFFPILFQKILFPEKQIFNCVSRPEELGSGSILAANCQYFANQNQFEEDIEKEAYISTAIKPKVMTFDARTSEGNINEICRPLLEALENHMEYSRIGSLVYGSKSGIKDDTSIVELVKDVLWTIDFCQFRDEPDMINHWIEQGCCVMITGSKFYQAPPFCGALIVPKKLHQKVVNSSCSIINEFHKVFSLYDFPETYHDQLTGLKAFENWGLHMRWACAIAEMEEYNAIPLEDRNKVINLWGQVVEDYLTAKPMFSLMKEEVHTDSTILSFKVTKNDKDLSYTELKSVFEALAKPSYGEGYIFNNLFMGQPVKYGENAFIRLAIGANNIRTFIENQETEFNNDKALIDMFESRVQEVC